MPACIIPIGPEFQDPDGFANTAPEIIFSEPQGESIVTLSSMFAVTARDENGGDTLHFRWIVDYPGPSYRVPQRDDAKVPGMNGGPHIARSEWKLDCGLDNLDPSLSSHRLTVVVADRPFTDNPDDIQEVSEPGGSFKGFWIWNVSCGQPAPAGPP